MPFINLKCIGRDGEYRPEGLKWYGGPFTEDQTVVPGDVVLANTDLTRDKLILGMPILIPDDAGFEQACLSHHLTKVTIDGTYASQGYVFELLQTPSARSHMQDHGRGSTVTMLGMAEVKGLPLRLPSLSEQLSEVALLARLGSVATSLRAEGEALTVLRSRCLASLGSGDHRVPELYDALLSQAV